MNSELRSRDLVRDIRNHLERLALRVAPTEPQRLLALTLMIGVVCGIVAVAFHEVIRLAESAFERVTQRTPSSPWIVWMLALPTGGGLLAGALLTRFFPQARGSGIPQVKVAYTGSPARLRLRDAVAKFFLVTLQIGTGASLGREGPTVQICSSVATGLGRLARLSPRAQRQLIPVGAAAGIAAAFNAPIAAVTFTVEEIVGKLDNTLLSGVIIAAALAAVIERSILGAHPVFDVPARHSMDDARSLLLYALLGLSAGVLSIAFTDLLLGLRKRFKNMKRVPEWMRPGIGGLVTGVIAVAALLLAQRTGVTGGGYATLRSALAGDETVKVMLILCACKVLATAFSYSSGGVGGVFAPVLFIGAMLGGAFGSLDNTLFGHSGSAVSAFALVGMGAMFSGAIRAPMTSVLIIIEMTSGYELILPLMIANMSSYLVARRFRPPTIYEALLEQDGNLLPEKHFSDALDQFVLKDLVDSSDSFVMFPERACTGELVSALRGASNQSVFPVLDDEGRVVGILTTDDLHMLAAEPSAQPKSATDLMRAAVTVRATDSLKRALERMRRAGLRELPVVDEHTHVIGFIDEGALADLYLSTAPSSSSSLD